MDRMTIGLVGARGYVGQELVTLLSRHPRFVISFVVSRTHAGRPVIEALRGAPPSLVFEDLDAAKVASREVSAVVLALPNDHARAYVAALDAARPGTVVVDVSADHRLDEGWVYGLPEINRARIAGAVRIANPGCYATAAALALAPVAPLLTGPAHAFGVSGYSGAGASPSPRNDTAALADNLMPYALTGHLHEREVSRHVAPVFLMPHVAPFFRGITMTVSLPLSEPIEADVLQSLYARCYEGEPLVRVLPEGTTPLVRDAVNRPEATLGGFAVDASGRHAVVVATLDNLLKGAASQAVQNLNLAFGFPERMGIEPWTGPL